MGRRVDPFIIIVIIIIGKNAERSDGIASYRTSDIVLCGSVMLIPRQWISHDRWELVRLEQHVCIA